MAWLNMGKLVTTGYGLVTFFNAAVGKYCRGWLRKVIYYWWYWTLMGRFWLMSARCLFLVSSHCRSRRWGKRRTQSSDFQSFWQTARHQRSKADFSLECQRCNKKAVPKKMRLNSWSYHDSCLKPPCDASGFCMQWLFCICLINAEKWRLQNSIRLIFQVMK